MYIILEHRFYYCTIIYSRHPASILASSLKTIPSFSVRSFHVNIKASICRHEEHLSRSVGRSASSLPPPSPSVGVKGGGEDDVPADGQRGLFHLAPQDRVAHDARRLPHLLQHLVQPLDAAHHRPLLDVG